MGNAKQGFLSRVRGFFEPFDILAFPVSLNFRKKYSISTIPTMLGSFYLLYLALAFAAPRLRQVINGYTELYFETYEHSIDPQ